MQTIKPFTYYDYSGGTHTADSLNRETWTICACPGGGISRSSCHTVPWVRSNDATRLALDYFLDQLASPPDYRTVPLRRLPLCIYRLPVTFGCRRSGPHIHRACYSIQWDPFHSADKWNRIALPLDLNTNNPLLPCC